MTHSIFLNYSRDDYVTGFSILLPRRILWDFGQIITEYSANLIIKNNLRCGIKTRDSVLTEIGSVSNLAALI